MEKKHLHVQVVPISFQLLVSRIDFYIYKLLLKNHKDLKFKQL